MSKPQAPCQFCTERSATCHSVCEKYQQYQKDQETFNSQVNTIKHAFGDYNAVRISRKRKKKAFA